MAKRRASLRWNGSLEHGSGVITQSTSGALTGARVSWPSRTADELSTGPEEMIAAAHATCFSMVLAAKLETAGFYDVHLDVSAAVSFEKSGDEWTIERSEIDVVATVSGLDENTLTRLTKEAQDCPVSRALAGNVFVIVTSSLSSENLAAASGP